MPILYILGIIFGAGAILWLLGFLFKIASIVIVALIIGFLVYYVSKGGKFAMNNKTIAGIITGFVIYIILLIIFNFPIFEEKILWFTKKISLFQFLRKTGFTQEFIHLFLLTISFFLGFSFRERVLEILSPERKQIESNKSKSKEIDKPKDFES